MVDRFQIALRRQRFQPRFISVSSRRLQNRAVFHVFSSAADRCSSRRLLGQPRDVGLGGSGCWYVFSISLVFLKFLLTSSFAAQSPHSPLLADGHGHPFPRGPTRPHHRPQQHMTTLTCALVTACAMSPCPSRLHPPHRCARVTVLLAPAYPLPVCFLFFFSANFLFAVQSLRSHHHRCRWMRGCPPPRPTTVQPPTAMKMPPRR